MIMTGSADQLTPLDTTVGPIYEGLPAPKLLWTIEGGDHYVSISGKSGGPLDAVGTAHAGEGGHQLRVGIHREKLRP